MLKEHEIDMLSMQETEIMNNLNYDELKIADYSLDLEKNSMKSRVGFYFARNVNYVRKFDLEGTDSNMIIIDIEGPLNTWLINVYCSFAPQNSVSQREKFKYQLSLLINTAFNISNP